MTINTKKCKASFRYEADFCFQEKGGYINKNVLISAALVPPNRNVKMAIVKTLIAMSSAQRSTSVF